MRKPRRLAPDELAPYEWHPPRRFSRWGVGELRGKGQGARGEADPPGSDLPLAPCPSPLDWAALFGNAHPVEVEVGMGKGLFLVTQAAARPGANFFGIEVVRKYQLYAATRVAVRQLPNVKTTCADAKALFRDFIAPGSVAAVHVLFPDPWWKARHKKRRVFTPEFAADIARSLPVGGELHVASDVAEYFGVMTGILRAMPAFRELTAETTAEGGYETNFERKARAQGTPVGRARYARTAEAVTVAPDPAAG
ncbi:MAG TPA: tRNA (guanosine(46)-N7)-methyltransferase TrmB [Urbifossiella sp.]|nr:tRNA (guanosine(46)-N7)-methyltransferase TrmB [Urbifossiella sp.]